MASIKNLKSKGRALGNRTGLTAPLNLDYCLRKQQYADSAPAKIMRPVRLLKAHYTRLLGEWSKAVSGGKGLSTYPWWEEGFARQAQQRSGFDSAFGQRWARALC